MKAFCLLLIYLALGTGKRSYARTRGIQQSFGRFRMVSHSHSDRHRHPLPSHNDFRFKSALRSRQEPPPPAANKPYQVRNWMKFLE